MGLNFSKDLMLDVEPLGYAFLDPVGIGDGLLNGFANRKPAFLWQGGFIKHRQRMACIFQNIADLAFGFRIGIKQLNVPAVQQKPRQPATTNNPAANYGCCLIHFSSLPTLIKLTPSARYARPQPSPDR